MCRLTNILPITLKLNRETVKMLLFKDFPLLDKLISLFDVLNDWLTMRKANPVHICFDSLTVVFCLIEDHSKMILIQLARHLSLCVSFVCHWRTTFTSLEKSKAKQNNDDTPFVFLTLRQSISSHFKISTKHKNQQQSIFPIPYLHSLSLSVFKSL